MGQYEEHPSIIRKIADLARKVSALERTQAKIPAGTIQATVRTAPPPGYLMCDGSAVSRSEYASLFAAAATRYGAGDGSTTFNLPNLNGGTFPRGNDGSGASGGAATHDHTMAHTHEGTTGAPNETQWDAAGAAPNFIVAQSLNHTHDFTTGASSAADTGSASSLPPFLDVNYMIKL